MPGIASHPERVLELSSWICREHGHSACTWLYFDWKQRLQFPYWYYMHQVESDPQTGSFLRNQRWYRNLSRSNFQLFHTPIRAHRNEYCGYQDKCYKVATHGLQKNICSVSVTQVRTSFWFTGSTPSPEQVKGPKQNISFQIYSPYSPGAPFVAKTRPNR